MLIIQSSCKGEEFEIFASVMFLTAIFKEISNIKADFFLLQQGVRVAWQNSANLCRLSHLDVSDTVTPSSKEKKRSGDLVELGRISDSEWLLLLLQLK